MLSGLSALTLLNYVDFGDRDGEPYVLVCDGQVINRPLILMVLSKDRPESDDSTGCTGEEVTLDPDTWLEVEEFVRRNPHLESEEIKEALRYLKE